MLARRCLVAIVATLVFACSVDTAPEGLRKTPPGPGATVVFDTAHRPLPEIPAPNDIATFPDPTSRTGRRINASLVAPSRLEGVARAEFNELEGWGTFTPITVSFQKSPGADPNAAAIDLENVAARMTRDVAWDLADNPVYLINLTTGVPMLLDAGGEFPATVVSPNKYWPNNPRQSAQNLLYETAEEGAGLPQSQYRPSLDTDFDGVLDHPNTFGPLPAGGRRGVDDLLTWYERETDTLLLRPMLALEEKTTYAVVLTDRLRGSDGLPVKSPFPAVHHPQQRAAIARLRDVLSDKSRINYYGDVAGTGLDHVAFAWTFTTQPTVEDMLLLRDGLYGKGPFARFATEYPPKVTLFRAAGKALEEADEPPNVKNEPACAQAMKTPFAVRYASAKETLHFFFQRVFSFLSEPQIALLEETLDAVDYVVVGTFDAPYLMGDPKSPDPDLHFKLNFTTGQGEVHRDQVHFWIAVPKAKNGHKAPFPVAYWRHGTTLHDDEILVHAGHYARQGIALAGIDAPGHGLVLDKGTQVLAQAFLANACLTPFVKAIASGRAIDLNGDAVADSGGLIWSAHLLHTRDGLRQSVLDGIQFTRVLRSFDGGARSDQDYNGDGVPDLAGDFNGDGIVDVGGPANRYYSSGGSFGGLVAMIHGAIDPYITASAPVSGGAGLVMDVATRSELTPDPVLGQVLGPLVVSLPAASREGRTRCKLGERSVRWVVTDLTEPKEIEIACASATEVPAKATVFVRNVKSDETRCGRADDEGRFRVPLPVSIGDRVEVHVYAEADVVDSYKTCRLQPNATLSRHIDKFEQAALAFTAVNEAAGSCDAEGGCAQFRDRFYPVGSPLVAVQEGLGLRRQTPDLRKLMILAQAAIDPSDPINFAAYYALRPLRTPDGGVASKRAIVDVHTVGDNLVPTGTGNTFSRATGALPFLPPSAAARMPEYAAYATPSALYDAWGARTPNQVLVDNWVHEGLSRFGRTPADGKCDVNFIEPTSTACGKRPARDEAACGQSLFDADYLGEAQQRCGQQFAAPPLRLARYADVGVRDRQSLELAWAPRIQGTPFGADATWTPAGPLVAVLNAYLSPTGQHDWGAGDPCQSWDGVTYMDALLARFFATQGADLHYLSHPKSHACLARSDCGFLQ